MLMSQRPSKLIWMQHVMNTLPTFIQFKTAGEKPHVPCDCASNRAARFLVIAEPRYGVTVLVQTFGLV